MAEYDNYKQKSKKFSSSKKSFANKQSKQSSHKNILSGLKPIYELIQSDSAQIEQIYLRNGLQNSEVLKIVDLCKEKNVYYEFVPEEVLNRLCNGFKAQASHHINHQGLVAKIKEISFVEAETLLEQAFNAPLPLIVALDQVLDPGNVGTLVRTLYALGVAGLIVPVHNSAFLGAGAKRSAAGSLEKLPISQVVNLARTVELASKSGYSTYAAELGGLNALETKLELPAILVLGSEEKGIRPGVKKHCTHKVSIPFLREFDSLNVAQAGAILTSCFLRCNTDFGLK